MSDWAGKMIGGYQIADEIGRGGMAIVCRAYQPQLERWVAIKIMHTEVDKEEFLARFRREARAIAALRHPNILTVYDYGEEGGIAYIVMEYVPGGSLKSNLTNQPVDWPDAATLVIPVGRALAYAHSQGVVHRDVKPANILLARPEWPLLADFGLIKLLDRQRGITRPGTSLGTPTYFSPEQAVGSEVDHRSDIYGLALVLYRLVTGRLPFEAESPIDAMLSRLRDEPTPPRQFCPQVSPRLESVIVRALSRNPDDRHPDMEALVADLSRLPGATGRAVMQSRPGAPGSTTARLDDAAAKKRVGPHLIVMGTGARISLPKVEEVLVGRIDPHTTLSPDVDLGEHGGSMAGVSRNHARLLRFPEGWLLEDLNSTNGTFVNQVQLTPGQPVRIRTGDIIRCGQLLLTFHEE
jgi:serine/threonine protein kinase